jgi:hypothetical protein
MFIDEISGMVFENSFHITTFSIGGRSVSVSDESII